MYVPFVAPAIVDDLVIVAIVEEFPVAGLTSTARNASPLTVTLAGTTNGNCSLYVPDFTQIKSPKFVLFTVNIIFVQPPKTEPDIVTVSPFAKFLPPFVICIFETVGVLEPSNVILRDEPDPEPLVVISPAEILNTPPVPPLPPEIAEKSKISPFPATARAALMKEQQKHY